MSGGVDGTYNFKTKPGVITEATATITIAGTITNFYGINGCTMKFTGGYQQRPE